jgi:hypothetical protein
VVAVYGNSPEIRICDRYVSTDNTFRFVLRVRSHLLNIGTMGVKLGR